LITFLSLLDKVFYESYYIYLESSDILYVQCLFKERVMTKQEKETRLAAAYQRMSPDGRDVLDRTVRQLAALPTLPGRTTPPQMATSAEMRTHETNP
jgi:hypothetical protein